MSRKDVVISTLKARTGVTSMKDMSSLESWLILWALSAAHIGGPVCRGAPFICHHFVIMGIFCSSYQGPRGLSIGPVYLPSPLCHHGHFLQLISGAPGPVDRTRLSAITLSSWASSAAHIRGLSIGPVYLPSLCHHGHFPQLLSGAPGPVDRTRLSAITLSSWAFSAAHIRGPVCRGAPFICHHFVIMGIFCSSYQGRWGLWIGPVYLLSLCHHFLLLIDRTRLSAITLSSWAFSAANIRGPGACRSAPFICHHFVIMGIFCSSYPGPVDRPRLSAITLSSWAFSAALIRGHGACRSAPFFFLPSLCHHGHFLQLISGAPGPVDRTRLSAMTLSSWAFSAANIRGPGACRSAPFICHHFVIMGIFCSSYQGPGPLCHHGHFLQLISGAARPVNRPRLSAITLPMVTPNLNHTKDKPRQQDICCATSLAAGPRIEN